LRKKGRNKKAENFGSSKSSADQLGQLAGLVFPLVSGGQRRFALGDAPPAGQYGQLGIELGHVLLVGGQVFFGKDGIHGAFWDAHSAVDALIGVDGQEVGAFAKAIHGANVHTVGVFALDTGFGNNVGHDGLGKWSSAVGLAREFGF
jgi:hypothetical protein